MASTFSFKRGSTFTATVAYTPDTGGLPNLIGCTVETTVLDADRKRHPLTVVIAEDGLSFVASAASSETKDWAFGDAYWDVKITLGDGVTVAYSETIDFTVVAQVTQ